MAIHDKPVSSIARAIERYLSIHPEASDSPAGIRSWWLPHALRAEPLPLVLVALDQLEKRGVVVRRPIEGGGGIYRRAVARRKRG